MRKLSPQMLYGNDRRRMNLAYILAGVFVALFLFFTITNINKAEKETRKVNEALQISLGLIDF